MANPLSPCQKCGDNLKITKLYYITKTIYNSPYSKTTALGGVETGRQNAIETDTAQGIIKYIGFI